VEGARAAILSTGNLEAATFEKAIDELQIWRKRSDPAIWFSICWAEGTKP
jgi:hypothetical protein